MPKFILNRGEHFPANSVPRALTVEEREAASCDGITLEAAIEDTQEKRFEGFEIRVELAEVSIPEGAFLWGVDGVRVDVGAARRNKYGRLRRKRRAN